MKVRLTSFEQASNKTVSEMEIDSFDLFITFLDGTYLYGDRDNDDSDFDLGAYLSPTDLLARKLINIDEYSKMEAEEATRRLEAHKASQHEQYLRNKRAVEQYEKEHPPQ